MDLNRMFTMIARRKLSLAIFACSFWLSQTLTPSLVGQTTRFWSDNSGSFSTEAHLLKINSASVSLRKTNQVVIEVPFSRLSPIDLDFVKKEINRRNGVGLKPAQSSSRNSQNFPPRKTEPAAVIARQPVNNPADQAPLKYSATPEKFEPKSLVGGNSRSNEPVAAVMPRKDKVAGPPSDAARLPTPVKLANQFSLGSQGSKKPPIMLRSQSETSRTAVAASPLDPTPNSLDSEASSMTADIPDFKPSLSTPSLTKPDTSLSSNSLRSSMPTAPSSSNELRSEPFAFQFDSDASLGALTQESKPTKASGVADDQNHFQPELEIEKASSSKNSFESPFQSSEPKTFASNNSEGKDDSLSKPSARKFPTLPESDDQESAIVILKDERSSTIGLASTSDESTNEVSNPERVAFSYEKGPDEVADVFSQPPKLGPRKTSFGASANSDFPSVKEPFIGLPPKLRKLANQIANSKNPREARAALSEIQNTWPSQRYPELVDAVQKCVSAPERATRILAIQTLAQRDQSNSLEYILKGIVDQSIDVREATHKQILSMTDPRIPSALAKKLDSEQSQRIAGTLAKLGSSSEVHVEPFTRHSSVEIQLTACKLLGNIGTVRSIKSLQTVVATSGTARVRLQASNAIDRIKNRSQNSN